jgi:hypothetical protein
LNKIRNKQKVKHIVNIQKQRKLKKNKSHLALIHGGQSPQADGEIDHTNKFYHSNMTQFFVWTIINLIIVLTKDLN